MGNARLHKYYRFYGTDTNWLTYQFLVTDAEIRRFFNLGPHCGVITLVTCIIAVVLLLCSIASSKAITSNEKLFQQLQEESDKKIPRKKSIVGIKPAYSCIHKHLRQTNVFQEKTKKMLRKEHLELEILNSRINCVKKLLKPEEQSKWRQSRSPKLYHRPINTTAL